MKEATPAEHVPKLRIPRSTEGERISEEVFDRMAATGRYDGVIGNTQVTFRESPLVESVRHANRGTPLYFSATPASDLVSPGPISREKTGLGAAEQYFFVGPDVNPNFMKSAAFGGGGGASGIHVYTPGDIADVGSELTRVVEADGAVKYFKGGYEAERGIYKGSQIPPTEPLAAAGIHKGRLYGSASVNPPSATDRAVANVKSFLPGAKDRGRFQFKPADPDTVSKRLDDAADQGRLDETEAD